jgi:hypothetical protein
MCDGGRKGSDVFSPPKISEMRLGIKSLRIHPYRHFRHAVTHISPFTLPIRINISI